MLKFDSVLLLMKKKITHTTSAIAYYNDKAAYIKGVVDCDFTFLTLVSV